MFPTRPEVECDAMQKKPSPPVPPKTDTLARRSRMIIQTGARRYALDICLRATELPTPGPAKVHMLNVETCYLRLTKPAALGDCRCHGGTGRSGPRRPQLSLHAVQNRVTQLFAHSSLQLHYQVSPAYDILLNAIL